MTRRRIAILFLPAVLLLAASAIFGWLLHTEPGARWIWHRVVAAVPGQLQAGRVSGNLQSGLRVDGLAYSSGRLAASADAVTLRLDLGLWPPAAIVHELAIGSLDLRLSPGAAAEAETPADAVAADWIPRLVLPVPFEFERVRVAHLAWTGAGAAAAPVVVEQLVFTGWWYRSLELHGMKFESPAGRFEADATIGLAAPFDVEVELGGSADPSTGGGAQRPSLGFRARGSGSLAELRVALETASPEAVVTGLLRGLDSSPSWDLELKAPRLVWPPAGDPPGLELQDLVATSYGSVGDFGVELDGQLSVGPWSALRARLVGSGNLQGLEFHSLHLVGDGLDADGAGRLEWADALRGQAALTIARFDPSPGFSAWGAAPPLDGRLEIRWHDRLVEFSAKDVTAPGTVVDLQSSGALHTEDGAIEARLDWRGVAWPPGAGRPRVLSPSGSAQVGGRLEAWTASGDLELSGPDFPPGRLQFEGVGDSGSLRFRVPRGQVLDGELAGVIEVDWASRLQWSVGADLQNLSTGPLLPDLPGRLSGQLLVRGRTDPTEVDIDLRGFEGVVRGREVRAEGGLAVRDGLVSARALQLRSGESTLRLDGSPVGGGGLGFSAQVASLGDVLDGGSGWLRGTGTVALVPGRPVLRLDLESEALEWAGNSVGRLVVTSGPGSGAAIRAEARDIRLGERELQSLSIVADGATPLERIDAAIALGGRRVAARLLGTVNDWSAPIAGGWSGRLEVFRLQGDAFGDVELENPAEVTVNGARLGLSPACFSGSRGGRLCLGTDWRPDGERSLDASLDDVSPNLALNLLDSELQLTQKLSGTLRWRQAPGAKPSAQVRLDISPGEITLADDDEPILATGPGLFGFEIADGRLFSGNLDVRVPQAGGIDADFSAPDLSEGLESRVDGRIRVGLDSIEPLLKLLPGIEGSSGPVTADLGFSGTLADPELTGHASLVRGRLFHFATGLTLEDITLAGAVYRYDQTELNGTFRAGDGTGSIRAVVDFDEILEPELLLELKGDRLTLVNVPDLNVIADPDVRLVWRQGELGVAGRILVPSARLSPRYLPTSAAAVSADVVIVSGADSTAARKRERPREWRLRGGLELELGDDVKLVLERATARLRGKTGFTWKGQPIPVAEGGFSLAGEIAAYGQLLKVTEGRINFSNRPADNPFLNIRAEREIYGNSQVRRAGVLVTGTLKQPILEPYSVPMTTRERALTMLVTGSDFNYEQGVGTVEVGTYVAPRLYISYGIGLFDEQNVVSARYDLGRGFGIKTTSGQRETGADISYTIER